MSPPKKPKPNEGPTQRSIIEMLGTRSSESGNSSVCDESKQNVLVNMFVDEMKNENGNDWIFSFNFDTHFLASNSQHISLERDVENETEPTSSSAATSRSSTPMDLEQSFDSDDTASPSSSG